MRIVVDHCRDMAIGEVCSRVGKADDNYGACALGWRPPIAISVVTTEDWAPEAVPVEGAFISVIAGEDDGGDPLVRRHGVHRGPHGGGVLRPADRFGLLGVGSRPEGGRARAQ